MTGADIQIDNGDYARVHNAILEALASARLSGAEFRCVLFLLRKTYGWNKKDDRLSLSQWADGTKTKRQNVHTILRELERKKIICRQDDGAQVPLYGFNKYVEQWQEIAVEDTTSAHFKQSQVSSALITDEGLSSGLMTVIRTDDKSVITEHDSTVITEHSYKRQLKTKDILPHAEKKRAPRKPKPELTEQDKHVRECQKIIMVKYREVLGYPVPSEPRENKGAQMLAKGGYTAEQVIDCYQDMKADQFWADKHVSLQSVNGKIGAWAAANNGQRARPFAVEVY
jgi:phage replication O-like protein O